MKSEKIKFLMMAQMTLERGEGLTLSQVFKFGDLVIYKMKVGLLFISEKAGVEAILGWGTRTICPIVNARQDKDLSKTIGTRGQWRYFEC